VNRNLFNKKERERERPFVTKVLEGKNNYVERV